MRRCGVSVTTRHRPSRASLAPTEITNPVGVVLGLGCIRTMQAAVSRPTPSSFFASKPGSYRLNANLLEPGLPANEALWCFSYNASSFFAGKPRSNRDHQPSGSGAWSGLHSDDAGAAVSRPTPSSFFASKPGSYRLNANLLEPGLPANEALRCFSYNASSFIASKPGSNGNKHFLWKILWAVVWCPRIRHRHS